jgi:NAD(P)-dependent dehydrogenase (short-subunit alcohol dehydrogenase family)
MRQLKDKVVVITGGSSGIGKALVAAALEHGAKVAVCARNLEKLQSIFVPSDDLFCFKADVSKEDDCKTFRDLRDSKRYQIQNRFGS